MSTTDHRPPVILVVDDEEILRMLATDYFADAGYEVIEAANGQQAMDLLHARSDIQAVVTDVHMPGRPDGFLLSRLVRDACPDCAIVVVSGRAAPTPGELAERAQYLPKPYSGREIVRLVDDLLSRDKAGAGRPG